MSSDQLDAAVAEALIDDDSNTVSQVDQNTQCYVAAASQKLNDDMRNTISAMFLLRERAKALEVDLKAIKSAARKVARARDPVGLKQNGELSRQIVLVITQMGSAVRMANELEKAMEAQWNSLGYVWERDQPVGAPIVVTPLILDENTNESSNTCPQEVNTQI